MSDPIMVRRVAAAQWTLDTFRRRKFKLGTADCVRMTAGHLRKLGYKVKLPAAGSYSSAVTAMRRLQERGFTDLPQALEAHGLVPIPPAAAIVGDVLQLEADHPLGALAIALGNGRVVGYHQDTPGAEVLQPVAIERAWRAMPL